MTGCRQALVLLEIARHHPARGTCVRPSQLLRCTACPVQAHALVALDPAPAGGGSGATVRHAHPRGHGAGEQLGSPPPPEVRPAAMFVPVYKLYTHGSTCEVAPQVHHAWSNRGPESDHYRRGALGRKHAGMKHVVCALRCIPLPSWHLQLPDCCVQGMVVESAIMAVKVMRAAADLPDDARSSGSAIRLMQAMPSVSAAPLLAPCNLSSVFGCWPGCRLSSPGCHLAPRQVGQPASLVLSNLPHIACLTSSLNKPAVPRRPSPSHAPTHAPSHIAALSSVHAGAPLAPAAAGQRDNL